MDFGNGKKRMSDNNNTERAVSAAAADRLSMLSNDLIHKILSYISIKDTVKTIALSSRYRFIWTTMPYLNFSTEDFPKLPSLKFSKFVTHFLSRRNTRIDVSSLKLSFRGKFTQPFVKKLMDYAFSHNIQQLDVECFIENNTEFPLSLLSSQSLKHLSLKRGSNRYVLKATATSTLELPTLTTLYLQDVTFCSDVCVGLLSKCANLKNLSLKSWIPFESSSFSICHPRLSNLTLDFGPSYYVKVVNVVAPQLKNLIIRGNVCSGEHVISAPNLASLTYRGQSPLRLSTDGFHCLKEADIRVKNPNAQQVVCLFQKLYNVKFLTLNLEIIELLSSSVELISHQPSPFVNLKSLTIYPEKISEWEMRGLPKGKVNLSSEVKKYLLDSSPGATFTLFSREEMIVVEDVASARKLMAELRMFLEQEKANTQTKGKAPMESDNAKMLKKRKAQPEMNMQLQTSGNIALIKSCWEDLSVQFKQRKAKASLIISKLESIEGLLKKLPATNRAMFQPYFSSLCAEVETFTSKLMKMQCDEHQSRISVCFHELAASATMEPSS